MDSNQSKPDKESLLTEYRIAHEKHDYYGKILWQMASIFLTASLAGFAFGIQQNLPLERFVPLNIGFVIRTGFNNESIKNSIADIIFGFGAYLFSYFAVRKTIKTEKI